MDYPLSFFTIYDCAYLLCQHILETGKQPASDDGDKSLLTEIKPKLRMIANAAGGLLPSTAEKLRKAFKGANILPSYGMTECMPISSPPATYELEKPGTSGVAVGPEIAIMAIDEDDCVEETPVNKEGHICVRGEPCFRGYGRSAEDETAPDTFLQDSWFDTGDLGYMDEDGYLYVTGRSKEVINRGGEIISPMEVEDAITHEDVVNACAFSAAHESLQEVVGVVLVMAKGRNRLDLSALHKHLDNKLESTKWPQCIVYMDDLPKSKTNKLLRVKLGKRFGFNENPLNDAMASNELHFEAECPPPGTSLKQPIEIQRVSVSAKKVGQLLNKRVATEDNQEVLVVDHPDRPGTLVCSVLGVDRIEAIETAQKHLDGYEVPTHFVEVGSKSDLEGARDTVSTPAPEDAVQTILQGNTNPEDIDPTVQKLQKLFIDMLELDHLPSPTDSFFSLGGSSILASQLASKIRKEFGVACSGAQVFDLVSCEKLATLVNGGTRKQSSTSASDTEATGSDNTSRQGSLEVEDQMQRSKHSANFSSDHMLPKSPWIAGLFQLVPVTLVFPIWQVTRYLMFLRCVVWLVNDVPSTKDIGVFILAYIFFQLVWQTVTPLIFVVIKWAVIGRYQEGRYPINGSYYLRWWFVDVCRKLFLRGIWGWNGTMLNIYYRMLGAKIGKGARIGFEADVAEYDLVSIGEDTAIEFSTVRGFGVDNGAMLLGKVAIGDRASVGIKSIVAPNTSIPMDAHLGPAMSSYEVDDKALNPENATVNRQSLQEAKWYYQLFVGGPILFLIGAIEQLPPLAILLAMLWYKSEEGIPLETVGDLVEWLVDPSRIPFFIGIRVARTMVSPFFYMGPAILVKRLVIGKFKEGPRDKSSDWSLFKSWLAATLFSRARMQDVTNIAGRHYGVVSSLYRALGAKIGKRVYWPGQQFIFNGEYDLLEIGDDVVFGSRSAILCSTTESFEKVVLTSGCNVADNCVVYPGSIIGSKAVLASNSVCPRGWYLPERSVWFGSKGGEPVCLQTGPNNSTSPRLVEDITKSTELPFDGRASTLSPFGKATHERKATYFVWPISLLVLTTFVIKTLIAVFHSLPLLAALHAGAAWLYGLDMDQRDYQTNPRSFGEIYGAMLLMFVFANIARIYVWFILELVAKWSIMGRRKMGEYNYDESSYGQRWEIYLAICTMRQWNRMSVLDFLSGSFWMNLYWHCNGCTIGKNVCLYPAGASPYMTEPDLVSIGDNSVVDRASVVCHLNTRGNFCLKTIQIGKNCTLRAQSRVQQGVTMEDGSMLLEKSLAMTGEVVEERSVWVGTPASWWFQYEDPSVAVSSGSNDDYHA